MSAENIDTKQDEVTRQVALQGPGERLREARLASKIDIEVIARQLHLTSDWVKALERDDYSEMTARVFVRGYIHNYARLVELPVDSILEQFDAVWPDDNRPVVMNHPPQLASDSDLGKRWSGMFSWLLLLIVVVLFLVWWQGYLDDFIQQNSGTLFSQKPNQEVQQPALIEEQPPEQAQTEPQPVSQPITLEPVTPESPESATEEALPTPVQDVAETVELPIEDNPPTDSASTEETEETEEAEEEVTQTGETGQTVAAEPVAAPQQTSTDQKEIYISFSGPCWVDIRDSERSFKILGQMKQGDRRKLGGMPPYDVVLGNTDVVSITVDGEPFDIKPYTNGSVARFTLAL
jgi:cytoskeleton protein RodZ